jgi:hypothetical protein
MADVYYTIIHEYLYSTVITASSYLPAISFLWVSYKNVTGTSKTRDNAPKQRVLLKDEVRRLLTVMMGSLHVLMEPL